MALQQPHSQSDPTPSLRSALSEPWPPQRANSCVTTCQNKHVCIHAQACGRVTQIAGTVNQRGDSIIANRMISGRVLTYLNGECFVIRRGYETTRLASTEFNLTVPAGLFVEPNEGPVLANTGLDNLRFMKPVEAGDSIKVRLSVKHKTPRNEDYGEVRWHVTLTNQDDEKVAEYELLTMTAYTS